MINLLPIKYKEDISTEKGWKIVMILGINLLLALVSFSLILFIIIIFISAEINFQKIIFEQKKEEFETPRMQLLEKNLISFNQIFLNLDYFYQDQIKFTEIIEEISQIIPSGIYLTDLSIKLVDKKEKEISCALVGFSKDRETLLKLRDILENQENISQTYLPTSHWVQLRDINFRANFNIKVSE